MFYILAVQRYLCKVSDIILASNNEDILLYLNLE